MPAVDWRRTVDTYLQAQADLDAFSGCVLIAQRGTTVFHAAYGLASIEHAVRTTTATRFKIFSVTKPITAAAILLLVHDGHIQLDVPVAHALPEWPAAWRDVTPAHLLAHTSGLPELTNQWANNWERSNLATLPRFLVHARELPLTAPPGTDMRYSNVGYELLGCLIEAVSGQPYSTFVQERIFTPLGMRDAGVEQPQPIAHDMYTGPAPVARLAMGYNGAPGAPELAWSQMYRLMAAGGIYATAADLARFLHALQAGEILPIHLRDLLWMVAYGTDGFYGYGWMLLPQFGWRCVRHDGGNNGFMTTLDWYPDQQLTLAVTSNYGFLDLQTVRQELLARVTDQTA
jgi:CubicO group peptidase (beta-lactamase class C family)